ncbi:MAG: hypothetical protein ACRCTZ_07630 [Sarcina sp.]
MKDNLIEENLKDVINLILKRSFIWIGSCYTIEQMLISFFYTAIKSFFNISNKEDITMMIYYILFIGIIFIVCWSIYEIFKSDFEVKIMTDKEHKIIIKIGDYADNMYEVLKQANERGKEAMFVIGINNKVQCNTAERRGVHSAVLKKFYSNEEEYEVLQNEVNHAFNKTDDQMKIEYGKSGIVDFKDDSKIMFIVNSESEEGKKTSIVGPQPKSIITSMFETLEYQSAEVVQVPILSSRNVKSLELNKIKYSITIAEIVESYFKEILNNKSISYDLVLSVRKQDLKENFLTAQEIIRFINNLKPMYGLE